MKTGHLLWPRLAVVAMFACYHLQLAEMPLAAEAPVDGVAVEIRTFQFQPRAIEVKAGSRVTWINHDDIRHTVTSGTPSAKDGHFHSQLAGKDASFTFTVAAPGTYRYFCDRHTHMRGEIVVK